MSTRTTRRTLAALAAPLVLGATLVAPATTAQAHSNVWVDSTWRDTDNCGCWLSDSYDGTYFKYDAKGYAYKGEIYSGQEMVGKVEFHPRGEQMWVYDTKANGDGFYVAVSWYENGTRKTTHHSPNAPRLWDLDIADGSIVTIRVWDDNFYGSDEILNANAVA